MPKIIGKEAQERALKQITALLKEVSAINSFLSAENSSGEYTVSFTSESKTKHSCFILSEERSHVNQLALNYKRRVKEQIAVLTEEHRIALDPLEQEMLNLDFGTPQSASLRSAEPHFEQ